MDLKKIMVLKEKTLTNNTVPVDKRVSTLKKLKQNIKKYEQDILIALEKDLGKPLFEAYSSEIFFTLKELDFTISNIKEFLLPKRVSTPLFAFRSSSKIINSPFGLVLILSPWNYPFQLSLLPLISAYATGNRVVLKSSNKSSKTSMIIDKLIRETFSEEEVLHIDIQGKKVIPELIDKVRFDKIFFTGSTAVGTKIYEAAAKTLTPVILELGGKSPCIINKGANLKISARRIVSSKFFNAGQTCIAPDYLLVHEDIKEKVISELKKAITDFYGAVPIESVDLGKIIDITAFRRLTSYLSEGEIICGGEFDESLLKISPTVILPKKDSALLSREIFGPILPVLTFKSLDEALEILRNNPEPLALYVFTKSSKVKKLFLSEKFGGGCINNAMMHLTNKNLPFGGIGNSGMGRYHGRYSFKAFTYEKSILESKNYPDMKLRYPPYKAKMLKYLKLL